MSWQRQVLRVNLTKGTSKIEPLNMEWANAYIGERGLGTKYLSENMDPKADPLGPDNVLVCSRHQDTVAILDWRTKELVWAWGQGVLSGPHDASWLANGHLLVFDNGLERGWSRVVEVDPATGEIVWQYRDEQPEGFFTLSRGSAQRLANGDTLIAESDRGRAFEVTPDGEIVWEYFSPHVNEQDERATIVRMKRHPAAEIDAFRAGHRPASQ